MFCIISYMMHVNKPRVNGGRHKLYLFLLILRCIFVVPGLLVTGRSGSGKTSILRAAAKALQQDARTLACECSILIRNCFTNGYILSDTLYVDLAKYTETPVLKVKSLLNYWFHKAFFHRPTVVIFDNMEKLMGIEQEVRIRLIYRL
jgi:peroxin-1